MTGYSSSKDVGDFYKQIGNKPLFVCDMDGNVMTGYTLNPGHSLVLGEGDNPANQAIPFGGTLDDLEALVDSGVLSKSIFAEKAMDARLPQKLVDFVNDSIDKDEPFNIAFLTSRGSADARKLLVESGVKDIDKVTLVADSGATLYIGGEKKEVRKLSDQEAKYLKGIEDMVPILQKEIEDIIKADLPDNKTPLPALFVEHKGIATNVHYRGILTALGEKENSDIDKKIGAAIKSHLQSYVETGPRDTNGDLTFKTLDGPATVEMKITSVNKGHGLEAIMAAALSSENKNRPTAVIFTGDDVSKGNGTPGTDWFAMDRSKALGHQHGVPTFNIHTHHPVKNDVTSDTPDADKSPSKLSEAYPKPPIALVVKTPDALADIILAAHGRNDLVSRAPVRPAIEYGL